jgi:choline dehydrogenase-like flavoprotein
LLVVTTVSAHANEPALISGGVAIVPSTLNPAKGARSESYNSYITEERPNLVVLTGHQVTKIDFNGTADGNVVASGVSFQADATGKSFSVKANKEVIVSSGAVGSPKILQLSGVGPKEVLEPLSVGVNVDLPVGYNFQDHVMVQMAFNGAPGTETWGPLCMNQTLQETALSQWQATKDGPLTYVNAATAC